MDNGYGMWCTLYTVTLLTLFSGINGVNGMNFYPDHFQQENYVLKELVILLIYLHKIYGKTYTR